MVSAVCIWMVAVAGLSCTNGMRLDSATHAVFDSVAEADLVLPKAPVVKATTAGDKKMKMAASKKAVHFKDVTHHLDQPEVKGALAQLKDTLKRNLAASKGAWKTRVLLNKNKISIFRNTVLSWRSGQGQVMEPMEQMILEKLHTSHQAGSSLVEKRVSRGHKKSPAVILEFGLGGTLGFVHSSGAMGIVMTGPEKGLVYQTQGVRVEPVLAGVALSLGVGGVMHVAQELPSVTCGFGGALSVTLTPLRIETVGFSANFAMPNREFAGIIFETEFGPSIEAEVFPVTVALGCSKERKIGLQPFQALRKRKNSAEKIAGTHEH